MSSVPPPPSREQVEERFAALLDGGQSRDEVDRWAAQWVGAPDGGRVEDAVVWWALTLICGIASATPNTAPICTMTSRSVIGLRTFGRAAQRRDDYRQRDDRLAAVGCGARLAAE
jgi:hypothetical protein